MSAINWLSFLNYLVERDNYTIDPHDDNARTDFDQGPSRVRRRFTKSRTMIALTWPMNANEMSVFETFYKVDLNNGTAWFNIPIYISDSYVTREARFVGKYNSKNFGAFDWSVSATLEIRDMPAFDSGTWYLIKLMLGMVPVETVLTDPLEHWVNVEYPADAPLPIWVAVHHALI
jgi:hypothetical protein